MENFSLETFFQGQSSLFLALEIVGILALLAKGADWLVGEAVVLSERSGLPKVIIGATIVSLGTTTPEAAVSVLAALQGQYEMALGNAVGSSICDNGLFFGISCLIAPLKLTRAIVNRQGWLQLGAGILLVTFCWPWGREGTPWQLQPDADWGNLSQWSGGLFITLLIGYLWLSVRWARSSSTSSGQDNGNISLEEWEHDAAAPMGMVVGKLLLAILLVVGASHLLIPAIQVAAERLHVPSSIVAATLVAFGTSLPELVTAVSASLKGHGDLAIGNIIGADILNVLFVAGVSAAVTTGGLPAPASFYQVLFPAMLAILIAFRIMVMLSKDHMKRMHGILLLTIYCLTMVLSYTSLRGEPAVTGDEGVGASTESE
jgi:cation:H+ antiporter